MAELWKGLPYLELKIVGLEDYNLFKDVIFAADRDMVPKGVVEVEL